MNNPKTRQQWIYELLKKYPTSSYTDIWRKYGLKWRKKENTFKSDWKVAKVKHTEYQNKANEAKEAASIEAEKDAAKNGLKSRIDRIMQLQNEIEHMESQLRGDVEFTFIVGNSIKTSHTSGVFILPVQVQNEIRREIRAHNSEISRLEGDYAATKSDLTTNGKSLNTSFQVEVIDRRENVENE